MEKIGRPPLIPPVEPVVRTQGERPYQEGEQREPPQTEQLVAPEGGERRWFVVKKAAGVYGSDVKLETERLLLTQRMCQERGLSWEDGEVVPE